ncbi:MAG TPA: hypothetical protein VNI61_08715 [Gemmatimonadales bacterium]|nr:hypothetical protein [Gemmatimonadales bacterium]
MRNRADRLAESVTIPAGAERLRGVLTLPQEPLGLVIFTHGSPASRMSAQDRSVGEILVRAGFATLLLDLPGDREGADRDQAFDLPLLGDRLVQATAWAAAHAATTGLPIGYFGTGTGAAAALVAAAALPGVRAVVSRSGRPDLAGPALAQVSTPTLLVVGAGDTPVVALNREALARLSGPKRLVIVPGATHLFPEPGALATVARLAGRWFAHYLIAAQPHPALAG